jgi:EAL domain-containing protein (putative c-di-GMP-specific phosphodiesterase class I)/GGDEF domain-containing protein
MQDVRQDPAGGLRDRLIGLAGLDSARQRLEQWNKQAADEGNPAHVHVMLIGLHSFDAVNLAYGPNAGDGALEELTSRISHFAGEELDGPWHLARSGESSFLFAANEACSREHWQLFAEQLAETISRPLAIPSGVLRLTPRVALLRVVSGESLESMLERLSDALAGANQQPGTRLAWAEGEAIPHGRSAAQLEADLLGAIDRDEIEILFQPQFRLVDDTLTGAEALARWNHPELGRIGAAALFAIAERADHVAPLSRHIAERALAAAKDWPDDLRLSINVTPADLGFGSYVSQFLDIVRQSGFPPRRVTLEVTEQSLLHDVQQAARMMADLCSQGIRIALDDFGAGFCNFRYLKVLPLHYLKLDRSMVDGITTDKRDLAVLRAIVAMARALDLEVIAEGIESKEQCALIAEEGCNFYQGFLRAKPMSGQMFAGLAGI